MRESTTREVAERWFHAVGSGNIDAAIACLSPNIEWINYHPEPGYNDLMSWIGTYHGVEAVVDSFRIFSSLVEVHTEELLTLIVDGEDAAGTIHEISTVRETGLQFEIEFVQWLTIRGGKIVRWKSYTDPSQIIRAMRPLAAKAVSAFAHQNAGVP